MSEAAKKKVFYVQKFFNKRFRKNPGKGPDFKKSQIPNPAENSFSDNEKISFFLAIIKFFEQLR